ncbi:MAG: hypothetical protein HY399_07700 [Elusimicrobia bacterium]|nr:hypothetical protein [Elusimicrobiota bacterium]
MSEFMGLVTTPLLDLWHRVAERSPSFIAALLFLFIGLVIARALRTFLEILLQKIKFDEYLSRIGMHEIMARLGLGKSPTYALTFIVFWSILFVFLVSAAKVLNLTVISDVLERFLVFLPKLLVFTLILFGGLLFGHFIHQVVCNSASVNNLRGGSTLAKFIYIAVLIFASLLALEQLGIEMAIVRSSLQIVLASVGLACAIAFGLGAKDLVEDMMRNFFNKKK